MKKLLLLAGVLLMFFAGVHVFAGESAKPVDFNNAKYVLYSATYNPESGQCTNIYYRESGDKSDMIVVMEMPSETATPVEYAELVQSRDHSPDGFDQPMSPNRQFNTATFLFILRGRNDSGRYVQMNITKAEPYKGKKGLRTVTYSKKYSYSDSEELQGVFDEINTTKQKAFNEMKEFLMPPVVRANISADK